MFVLVLVSKTKFPAVGEDDGTRGFMQCLVDLLVVRQLGILIDSFPARRPLDKDGFWRSGFTPDQFRFAFADTLWVSWLPPKRSSIVGAKSIWLTGCAH